LSTIAELFGVRVVEDQDEIPEYWTTQYCPFTQRTCDVSGNRSDRAFFDMNHASVTDDDRRAIEAAYGTNAIPLGICSLNTKRHNETVSKPWIVCPKRLMDLRDARPNIPAEVRRLVDIEPGTLVRCWWEVKFRSREPDAANFFEFTFDYLLIPLSEAKEIVGPPYIFEVMTSSTRGGGLAEHMTDALLGRKQRSLGGGVVDSPYTPNYRQVSERMLGQLFAKSEVAEAWGGRAIWLVQDVLLDYIQQTTDFRADEFPPDGEGNVFMEVFGLDPQEHSFDLRHVRSLRGFSRPRVRVEPDFTGMLGLGYEPPVELLYATLRKAGMRRGTTGNWIDFRW
jgi:hypothetical protein